MKTINPFRFDHHIQANASKSDAQRCLILAAFSSEPSILYGLDQSDDVLSMQESLSKLGAHFQGIHPTMVLPSTKHAKKTVTFNVGESGFALRTLAFLCLIASEEVLIQGKDTLLNRTQDQLIEMLEKLGLFVESMNGKLPLRLLGKPKVSEILVDGSAGSQAISGLFLLAPHLPNGLKIYVKNLKSKPYLEMTIQRMCLMGIQVERIDDENYYIPGEQNYQVKVCHIEGDWSGAANLIVGAAISGKVQISGLEKESLQADRKILDFVSRFGASVTWSKKDLLISKGMKRKTFEANIEDCPDLFPILVVLACAAKGTSMIQGVDRLKNKESDRLLVMCELLKTFGVSFQILANTIYIDGNGTITGALVDTHHDHRIAMAATIAACISKQKMILSDASCVSKSYPNFFNDLGI